MSGCRYSEELVRRGYTNSGMDNINSLLALQKERRLFLQGYQDLLRFLLIELPFIP
jgi:hypothetical protein